MKTIYKCEICGKEFTDANGIKGWEACHEHEKGCEEKHATGIRLAKDINVAIKAADERGGVEIAAYYIDDRDNNRAYRLRGAAYDAKTAQINLEVDFDDRLQNVPTKEGSDNVSE